MPASMTMALVALRPKVAGSSRLMPASGPTPGSTPTMVPMKQPMKAYSSTDGASATVKPRYRFCSVSIIGGGSEPAGTTGQRHAQQRVEQEEGAERERDHEHDGGHETPALYDADEEPEHRGNRQPVAQSLEAKRGEGAGAEDRHCVGPFRPAQGAHAGAGPAEHRQRRSEEQQDDREEHRRVARARVVQRSDRQR